MYTTEHRNPENNKYELSQFCMRFSFVLVITDQEQRQQQSPLDKWTKFLFAHTY